MSTSLTCSCNVHLAFPLTGSVDCMIRYAYSVGGFDCSEFLFTEHIKGKLN